MGIERNIDMASGDYCSCKVCGNKSFYDAHLAFEDVLVGSEPRMLPVRCGDYAGLCMVCATTHKLEAVKLDNPVEITIT